MTDHDVVVATPPTNNDDDDGRLDQSIAEELIARARAEGVDLVGPGGLLVDLTKQTHKPRRRSDPSRPHTVLS